MTVEICTVSGFDDVGRNMVAVRVDDEVVICDMGIHLENYMKLTDEEEENSSSLNRDALIKARAIPDDGLISEWKGMVKAIVPSHAHLDHLGAIPYLAHHYDAPIMNTPYTVQVLRHLLEDNDVRLRNKLQVVEPNGRVKLSKNITLEMVNITHSTPHTAMVVIHTPAGAIVYANDFKLDDTPTLGKPPNYARLAELEKEGTLAIFIDSTNADVDAKTPSEKVAKDMLSDVLMSQRHNGRGIIVTTFSSHIARLKSIIEIGQKMGRKVVILGRSMAKYISAAEEISLVDFKGKAEIVRFSAKVGEKLRKIDRDGKEKYLIICTGHQGEPKSVLSKIASGLLNFNMGPQDAIVFSCRVIPTPTNRKNRERLESHLRRTNVRIFKDVHQSGHASGQDVRYVLELLKPKHIIPSHGAKASKDAVRRMATMLGYGERQVHMAHDGQRVILSP
ncbi:TPA: RNase J family beta-CASP ribonuclease [Candidatus Woesearchaeota archaeon]|nr:RNase J family beta-CASP ribonuclease [Candidatus Woesearchaeota archaeon]